MADSVDSAIAPEIHQARCVIMISPARNPETGLLAVGQRGPLYNVTCRGELIVERTAQPLLDGARALAERGLSGPFEMWDHVRPFPRMRSTIEAAARLRVTEGEGLPRFREWTPHPGSEIHSTVALQAQGGLPKVASYNPTCQPEKPL